MVKHDQVKEGDILNYWFDTGAMGAQLCFAKVLKVGPKKIKTIHENGYIGWRYASKYDDILNEKNAQEIEAEITFG